MTRIVLGSYMVRYPLGGMMSWVLQYLVGFQKLGHDVYFVERSSYPNACYDPSKNTMSDDRSYGMRMVKSLLERFGLHERWCFVDETGNLGLTQDSQCHTRYSVANVKGIPYLGRVCKLGE